MLKPKPWPCLGHVHALHVLSLSTVALVAVDWCFMLVLIWVSGPLSAFVFSVFSSFCLDISVIHIFKYVCIHMYICMCMYVYIYIYMYACVYINECVYIYIYILIDLFIYLYTHVRVHAHVHTSVLESVRYKYLYIRHMYTHTYVFYMYPPCSSALLLNMST